MHTVQTLDPNRGLFVVLLKAFVVGFFKLVRLFRTNTVGMMRLIVEHQHVRAPSRLDAQHTLQPGSVRLHITRAGHLSPHQGAAGVELLFQNFKQAGSHLGAVVGQRQVARTPCGGGFVANANAFHQIDFAPSAHDLGSRSGHFVRIAQGKHMPVHHQHPALRQGAHQMRRHEIAAAVQTGFATGRVQLSQATADCHIGAHHHHRV